MNTHRFPWWSAAVRIMVCGCLCVVGFGAEAKAGGHSAGIHIKWPPKPPIPVPPPWPHPDPVPQTPSQVEVLTFPTIDNDGNVWSGTTSGGTRGHIVGRATLEYDQNGQAYWVSNYQNGIGMVDDSPLRAPQYDQPPAPAPVAPAPPVGLPAPPPPPAVSFSFTIQNPNGDPVYYKLGDQVCTLPAGQQTTWTGTGQLPMIWFDNGHNQMINYSLDSGRTYQFVWNQDVLDLIAQ
ncbi:MAG TPA: hypothetical protein VMS17_31620 [Gemmataceae bacterium]|nr:hypothetical protein [Gemmataceae bacterium]